MKELRDNLDLLAIAVLIAVLGLAHAPRVTPRISDRVALRLSERVAPRLCERLPSRLFGIPMEQPAPRLRIQKLRSNAHTIPYMR